MRLPFLQVTQEAWDHAAQLSALIGLSEGDAFFLLCNLWRWGLGLGPADQAPTGLCDSPRAARLLAAAVGWKPAGDAPDALVEALVDLGLVERLEVGLRVKGLDRYAEAWERNRAKKARWQRANERRKEEHRAVTALSPRPTEPTAQSPRGNRAATDSEPPPKTQTQTQTQTHREEEAPPPPPREPAPVIVTPPDTPPETWSGEDFWRWFQSKRQAAGFAAERPPGRLSFWWSPVMLELNGNVERLKEGVYRFGEDPYWQQKNLPFNGFKVNWPNYVPREAANASA